MPSDPTHVAKPSLSQRSFHHAMVTRLPNHCRQKGRKRWSSEKKGGRWNQRRVAKQAGEALMQEINLGSVGHQVAEPLQEKKK